MITIGRRPLRRGSPREVEPSLPSHMCEPSQAIPQGADRKRILGHTIARNDELNTTSRIATATTVINPHPSPALEKIAHASHDDWADRDGGGGGLQHRALQPRQPYDFNDYGARWRDRCCGFTDSLTKRRRTSCDDERSKYKLEYADSQQRRGFGEQILLSFANYMGRSLRHEGNQTDHMMQFWTPDHDETVWILRGRLRGRCTQS